MCSLELQIHLINFNERSLQENHLSIQVLAKLFTQRVYETTLSGKEAQEC